MQLFYNLFGTRLYITINKSYELAELINVLPTRTDRAPAAAFTVLGRKSVHKDIMLFRPNYRLATISV